MTVEISMGERDPHQFNLEDVARFAKEVTLKQGWHIPTIIAEGTKRSIIGTLAEFPNTHEEKVDLMFSTGFGLAQSGEVGKLKQVFLISEGWMSVAEEGKPPEMQPSLDPNRKEVLLVSNLVIEQHQGSIVVLEMVRDVEGKLIDLREFQVPKWSEEGRVESPLLDAFAKGFRLGRMVRGN